MNSFFLITLHPAHSNIGRGSVKTLCSPLSVEFWRHCVLNGGTQRQSFTLLPGRRNNNIYLN